MENFQQEIIVYTQERDPAEAPQDVLSRSRNLFAHFARAAAKWAKLAVDSQSWVAERLRHLLSENFAIFIFDLPFWLKSLARKLQDPGRSQKRCIIQPRNVTSAGIEIGKHSYLAYPHPISYP